MIQILNNKKQLQAKLGGGLFIDLAMIAAGGLLLPVAAFPNTPQPADIPQLTLNKAVELALQNNSDLKTTRQTVRSAETTVLQKKASYYPTLEISSKASHEHDTTAVPGSSYSTPSYGTYTTAVSSSVNIFNGFADQAAVDSAGFSLSAERQSLNREQQSTVYQTISKFIVAVTNQELVMVKKDNLQDNRLQLKRIEAFFKAGKRPVTDLYQQQAETSQAELTLLDSARDLQTSKLELLQAIGLAATERFLIVAPKIPPPSYAGGAQPVNDILDTALVHRTDLKSQDSLIEAAKEDIKVARGDLWPKISLTAEINSNYSTLGKSSLANQLDNPGNVIGLSITIPIFDGWKTEYSETQAKIKLNKKQIAREKLSRQIGIEVAKVIQAFQIAAKQLEVAEIQVQYAQQSYAASEERYNVGVADILELSSARKKALQARYDRIKALYDLLLQRVAISYYQGDTAEMLASFATQQQGFH
jgi:outer membrane protein